MSSTVWMSNAPVNQALSLHLKSRKSNNTFHQHLQYRVLVFLRDYKYHVYIDLVHEGSHMHVCLHAYVIVTLLLKSLKLET